MAIKSRIKLGIPRYKMIKEILRNQIFSYPGEISSLSESQIIAKFKVSATTARRVLDEFEEEGLVRREVGKGSFIIPFLEKESKNLGVIFFNIFDTNQPFISETVRGIEEKLQNKNYYLQLYAIKNSSIFQNPDSSLSFLISRRKIDGLFVFSPISISDLEYLQKEKIPFVIVEDYYLNIEIPTVNFDHKKAVKEVTAKLLEFGYKKIALITGPKGENYVYKSHNFAIEGYKEFLSEHNFQYDEKLVKTTNHTEVQGYQVMEEFYLLPENEKPEAIIIATSKPGKGALKFTEENKNWNPFIITYSDEEINYPNYILAPYRKLGETAVDLLEKYMKDYTTKPEKILIPLDISLVKN